MNITDPIADMLTRLRNAQQARHKQVTMPSSKAKTEIARILQQEGYIQSYEVTKNGHHSNLELTLKYGAQSEHVISGIKRISRPGLRVYAKKDNVPTVLGGLGIAILSTSHGVMTSNEARRANVGGEVLAYVW